MYEDKIHTKFKMLINSCLTLYFTSLSIVSFNEHIQAKPKPSETGKLHTHICSLALTYAIFQTRTVIFLRRMDVGDECVEQECDGVDPGIRPQRHRLGVACAS